MFYSTQRTCLDDSPEFRAKSASTAKVRLKENNVRKGFFEREHFVILRSSLPNEVKPIVTFAFWTGCRKGEILSLIWPQVDLIERVVRLEPGETKNDEARVIPLVDELYEMLAMQKAARDLKWPECPWVFSRCGRKIKNFRRAWDQACKAAGIIDENGDPARVFHDLRRTGVRNLIRAGVPERVAMMISGHKTRSVFDRYNIVSERDLHEAGRRLNAYIRERESQSGDDKATPRRKHSRIAIEDVELSLAANQSGCPSIRSRTYAMFSSGSA